jgi:ribosomal subunit interface protein
MIVQVNTDNHINGSERMNDYVSKTLKEGLKHYVDIISRAEVHMSDVNADKGGPDDIQCKIEVRVEGQEPILAESKNETQEDALTDALKKIQAALKTIKGKMQEKYPQR